MRARLAHPHQFWNRDREEGAINGAQPQGADGFCVRIEMGTERETHIDNESHAKFAQLIVVIHRGHTANEEVIGDLREVHAGNRIIGKLKDRRQKSYNSLICFFRSISWNNI